MSSEADQPSRIPVQVTCTGADLQATCRELERRGLKIDSVLAAIRVVTGDISPGNLAALEATPGVVVEVQPIVQLPPPDAPLQ